MSRFALFFQGGGRVNEDVHERFDEAAKARSLIQSERPIVIVDLDSPQGRGWSDNAKSAETTES